MTDRLRAQKMLLKLLEMFCSEIRYGRATLAECCEQLADRVEEPYQSALRRICRSCQEAQTSFSSKFCAEMEKCLSKLPLDAADRAAFLEPFRTAGFQDRAMQLKCLEQGGWELQSRIALTEKELPVKCRLAVSLGGMSGLLVLIILL